ncbi:MAG: DUF401 family protein [Chitinivibrionales bacterium]
MIDFLMTLPAFLKVSLIFVSILAACKGGLPLGISILLHSLALTLWSGAGFAGLGSQLQSFVQPESYLLFLVILLLQFFTEALSKSGRMSRTVDALRAWMSSHKTLVAGLPALVGLLPMPGGALFSAPLVESVDTQARIRPPVKVAINYWFRHIWEYWWPLYPGVIMAIRYSKIPVGIYLLVMAPFTIAAVLGGYFFILRHVKTDKHTEKSGQLDRRAIAATLFPISILVAFAVTGSIILPSFGVEKSIANLLSMLAGLVVGLGLVFMSSPNAFRASLPQIFSQTTAMLMLVIIGVQSFSSALSTPIDETTTIVSLMRDEFVGFGIPVALMIVLLPFVSGAVTGIAVGFVGASFPLVFALLSPQPSLQMLVVTTVLAYSFGYIGMLLSPVHVCLVVTNEFFKTRLYHAYPLLVGPLTTVLVSAFALAALYYFVF